MSPGNDRTWKGSCSQGREGKTIHENSCSGLGVYERTVSKGCEPNETRGEKSFLFVVFQLQRCPECAVNALHLLKIPGKKAFALNASNSTHSADEDTKAESLNLVELYIILVLTTHTDDLGVFCFYIRPSRKQMQPFCWRLLQMRGNQPSSEQHAHSEVPSRSLLLVPSLPIHHSSTFPCPAL